MGAEEGDTRRLEIDGKRREWEVVSIERAPDL
jgi:transcription elongation GreA/GreB family factor